jgi:hypothetical protein
MFYKISKYTFIILILSIQNIYAGTGSARDVNYLFALVIVFLFIILSIAFLISYIHDYFRRKRLKENSLNDVHPENGITYDDDNPYSNHT